MLLWYVAPVEDRKLPFSSTEYSQVKHPIWTKYSGLSSRRPGFESRPEHHSSLK